MASRVLTARWASTPGAPERGGPHAGATTASTVFSATDSTTARAISVASSIARVPADQGGEQDPGGVEVGVPQGGADAGGALGQHPAGDGDLGGQERGGGGPGAPAHGQAGAGGDGHAGQQVRHARPPLIPVGALFGRLHQAPEGRHRM